MNPNVSSTEITKDICIEEVKIQDESDEDIIETKNNNYRENKIKKINNKNISKNSKNKHSNSNCNDNKNNRTYSNRFYNKSKDNEISSNKNNNNSVIDNLEINDISAIDHSDAIDVLVPVNIPNGFMNLNSPVDLQSSLVNCNYIPRSSKIKRNYVCDLTSKVEGNDGPLYSNLYLYNQIRIDNENVNKDNKLIPYFKAFNDNNDSKKIVVNCHSNKINKSKKNRFGNRFLRSKTIYEIKN
jgi:hypothetical protein